MAVGRCECPAVLVLYSRYSLLAIRLYLQWVLDQVVVSADRDLLTTLAIGFALVAILRVLTTALRGYLLMYVSSLASVQWQSNVFAHLRRLPTAYFEKRHIGDVVSRFHAVDSIQQTLSSSFFSTVLDGIMGIGVLVMMMLYSWQLSLLSFLLVFLTCCCGCCGTARCAPPRRKGLFMRRRMTAIFWRPFAVSRLSSCSTASSSGCRCGKACSPIR